MLKYDISGQKFGYWTVIKRDDSYISPKKSKWICKCECGTIRSVFKQSLLSGRSTSCGCHSHDNLKGINSTHGLSHSRIYHEWLSMRRRCSGQSTSSKNRYYSKIHVCNEWQTSFEKFYQWAMSHGYSDSLSIDRIDNNGDYTPDNCRWIPIEEQQSNKSNNVYIIYNGQKYCLRSLCTKLNFPYKTAHRRLQRMKSKNKPIDISKLFEPIHEEKISLKYRKQEQ